MPLLPRALRAAIVAAGTLAAGSALAAEPVHHAVELTLTPAEHGLDARDTITLSGSGEQAFFLRAALEVSRVTVDGEDQAIRRDGDQLTVELGAPDAHTVEIAYAGSLDVGRQGPGVGPTIRPDGSVLPARSGWLPRGAAERITYRVTLSGRLSKPRSERFRRPVQRDHPHGRRRHPADPVPAGP